MIRDRSTKVERKWQNDPLRRVGIVVIVAAIAFAAGLVALGVLLLRWATNGYLTELEAIMLKVLGISVVGPLALAAGAVYLGGIIAASF